MIVQKFGGTSLGDAQRMKNVADIAAQHNEALVVLSAVSGTTDSLVKLVDLIKHQQFETAKKIVSRLYDSYLNYIESLYLSADYQIRAKEFVEGQFEEILSRVAPSILPSLENHLLAKGELISTELFHLLLQERGIKSNLISALEFLRLDQENVPDEAFLAIQLSALIAESPDVQIHITQGFICRNAFGEVSNLKRGGSDYSASLFGAALNCQEVQIWTDIDGMHNNDPRYVKGTRPIRNLSFDEAAELAYFGAKILHPSSIKPARKKNIPVRLLNTLEPAALGTLISATSVKANIKAIAAKDGITAIKIKSSEMLQAPGFLRRIFEVFELYQTSIDAIATSEVAVSVTIDDSKNLQSIVKTLAEFGRVEVDENLSIICVVGEFLVESSGVAAQVINSLKDIPIRMISYGGSAHNITLLVSEEQKINALNSLHRGLFNV